MRRNAKAPSARSIDAANSRGLRSAFATRGAHRRSKGSGARAVRLTALLVVSLTALLATAAPALAGPPTAVTLDPTDGSYYTSAHLSGSFQTDGAPDNNVCVYSFEYSKDGVNWSGSTYGCGGEQGPLTPGVHNLSEELTGLENATEYHVRLSVSFTGAGGSTSSERTFTTNPEPTNSPALLTKAISPADVAYTTAHLSGAVDPEGGNINPGGETVSIKWHFQYSTDPVNLGWSDGPGGEITGAEAEGSTPIAVSVDPPALTHHTTYFFRLVASYGDVQAASPEPYESFETLEVTPPTVVIDPITVHTDTTAHFSGLINPNAPGAAPQDPGFDIKWHFVCTPECPGIADETEIKADNASHVVEVDATGLEPDTTYNVTLEATNAAGPVTDAKTVATTLIPPTVQSAPGASDGKGGYTLQGIVNPHNSTLSACAFEYGPTAAHVFSVPCSPTPGGVNKPVTVEGHVTGLTPGATYHASLVVSNGAGTKATPDQIFIPTLDPVQDCANEQLRTENSSLGLPECRAYEQVTPSNKAGYSATRFAYSEDGPAVGYQSNAGNIANSGSGASGAGVNSYVSVRSSSGWETIANLNGPNGSLFSAPYEINAAFTPQAYSSDLRSSFWWVEPHGEKTYAKNRAYLRKPDGSFVLLGGAFTTQIPVETPILVSDDLSHVVIGTNAFGEPYGPGIYEFVGTGNDQPRRVDVDNAGNQVGFCSSPASHSIAVPQAASSDGQTIFFAVRGASGGCVSNGTGPPTNELWARVNGVTSFDVSASLCTRVDCNAPADATFQGVAKDGSRVYFTTAQQLVNGDVDQTNDLYACDIPAGNPAPIGTANPCPSLTEVSGGASGARVEAAPQGSDLYTSTKIRSGPLSVVSADGSTVYFVAQGVLATNNDAFGEPAVSGDHNLYSWRQDAAHPAGQTTFIGKLDSFDDVRGQSTPDGSHFAFSAASHLVPTDTDNARDIYRFDAETAALVRVSTNISGVAGNGDDFNAVLYGTGQFDAVNTVMSNDGSAIVFTTSETLSPLDGNGTDDVYLWKEGRVSLISTGSVGGGGSLAGVNGSGQDIYFSTAQGLTPSDGDDVFDVYDARIGGGFSFAQAAPCSGEACQTDKRSGPPTSPAPATSNPGGEGNLKPKHCAKGKVLRKGHCVKKRAKKKRPKNGRKAHAQRAGLNRGGIK